MIISTVYVSRTIIIILCVCIKNYDYYPLCTKILFNDI